MVFIEMENNMNGSELLNLSAAIGARNHSQTQEELGKLIPNPRETLNLKTLRSISKLLEGINHPVLIEFFLNELTTYIQERGIQVIAIIFLAQNCAVTFFNHYDELTNLFLLLKDRYPTAEQYQHFFFTPKTS